MQALQYALPYIAPDTLEETAVQMSYVMYGFMGLCAILGILGELQARKAGADNVRVMGIVYFGIYTWDFFSDVIFNARLV